MLLKLIPLLAMLFLNDAGGAGGEGGNENVGDASQNQGGDGNQSQGDGGAEGSRTEAATKANSVNRQIKDFAAQRGISVEDLLGRFTELEDATKTESERLTGERDRYKGEADQLRDELRSLRSEAAFLEAAREARARAPKTLYRAFRDQLDYDTQGAPTNIADVIAAAREDEPDLFHAATGTSDAGRKGDGDGGVKDINALIRSLAAEAR